MTKAILSTPETSGNLAPVTESETKRTNISKSACPHAFHTSHYCDYLNVQLLEPIFSACSSFEQVLFSSALGSAALLCQLQCDEIASLLSALQKEKLPTNAVIKTIRRCEEAAQLVVAQDRILQMNNRRTGVPSEAATLIHSQRLLSWLRLALKAVANSTSQNDIRDEIMTYTGYWFPLFNDAVAHLLSSLHPPNGGNSWPASKALAALVSYSPAKAAQHNPDAASDERTFILSHHIIEIWLRSAIASVQRAIDCLNTSQTSAAEKHVRITSTIINFLRQAIHLPETITCADYLLFRDSLSGSGIESVAIRHFEILAGIKDADYFEDLGAMHLLTPLLQKQCEMPSLYDSFLQLLVTRGVSATEPPTARAISRLLQPTLTTYEHRDLTDLLYALLKLSQEYKLWQADHVYMAAIMIGQRPSLGVADFGEETGVGRLEYLYRVLGRSPLFPKLWEAISYA
jgi:tryptophan 2,3-dioxygenase